MDFAQSGTGHIHIYQGGSARKAPARRHPIQRVRRAAKNPLKPFSLMLTSFTGFRGQLARAKRRSRPEGIAVPTTTERGWLCATGALREFPMLPLAEGLRGLTGDLQRGKLLLRRIEIVAGGSIVAVAIRAGTSSGANAAAPSGRTRPLPQASAPHIAAPEERSILCARAVEASYWLQKGRVETGATSPGQPARPDRAGQHRNH